MEVVDGHGGRVPVLCLAAEVTMDWSVVALVVCVGVDVALALWILRMVRSGKRLRVRTTKGDDA